MKPVLNATRRQLLDTLQNQMIPWLGSGAPIALLDAPPHILGSNLIHENPGKILPDSHGTGKAVQVRHWQEENMDAASVPMIGCVLDGEADIAVGTTAKICRTLNIPGTQWVVELPQRSFFIVPPNVPVSSVGKVHWYRSHPEKAYSRMCWMQVHENGVYCHFNASSQGKLWISPHTFEHHKQLFPLANNLIYEMQRHSHRYTSISYFHLNLLLEFVLQNLMESSRQSKLSESATLLSPITFSENPHITDPRVRKILEYITDNLSRSELNTEMIAAHFNCSPTHLRRMFQAQLSTSLMKFLTQKRMEFAQQLLLESSFNIEQISEYSGYRYQSNFTHAFLRHFGVSPSQYRTNVRNS